MFSIKSHTSLPVTEQDQCDWLGHFKMDISNKVFCGSNTKRNWGSELKDIRERTKASSQPLWEGTLWHSQGTWHEEGPRRTCTVGESYTFRARTLEREYVLKGLNRIQEGRVSNGKWTPGRILFFLLFHFSYVSIMDASVNWIVLCRRVASSTRVRTTAQAIYYRTWPILNCLVPSLPFIILIFSAA